MDTTGKHGGLARNLLGVKNEETLGMAEWGVRKSLSLYHSIEPLGESVLECSLSLEIQFHDPMNIFKNL